MEYWKNVFKKWANERDFHAFLGVSNTVTVLCIQKFSNFALINKIISMDPCKTKDEYPLCFQKLLKLPSSLRDLGNFSSF